MKKKKISLMALIVCLLMLAQLAMADNYRVLFANSANIRIGNQIARKGIVFNDNDNISWTSDNQALKVLNLSTNRIMIIAKKAFDRKNAKSLADYLRKVKHLSTREYGTESVVADTVFYLLDTLRVDAGKHYGDDMIDEAVLIISNDTITTNVIKSKDKKEFLITPKIYGGKNPSMVYIDIVETDKQRDWRYYIYRRLRIEQLPMRVN